MTADVVAPPRSREARTGERRFRRLRTYNVVMGLFHAAQAVAVLVLANGFTLPVTATFLEGPPGAGPASVTTLVDVSVAWGVAGFLILSAAAHAIIASPGVFAWYRLHLEQGRNYARWIEYSLSSSLMVVLIAMLTGIGDVSALLAIAGVNAAMILFGLLFEHYEPQGTTRWMAFWFGVVAGAIPWIAIGTYLWSPTTTASPPTFVYAIFVSLFLFFNSFAINMWLQYRRVGKWRDYLFGEVVYVALSLIAKSALAWQVFASTLAP